MHGFAAESARLVIADVDAEQAAKVQAEALERGATKAALIALARTTAREHGHHGIRANVVCPGLALPDGPGAVGSASLWAVGQDAVFSQQQIDYLRKTSPAPPHHRRRHRQLRHLDLLRPPPARSPARSSP